MNVGGQSVSRETFERLKVYESLLKKWNPAINLVSKATLPDTWDRHIADSAQIYGLSDGSVDHWADIGSGGGFPGMVIAIIAFEKLSPKRVSLVESDTRKCTFLRTVARELGVPVNVIDARIENIPPLNASILSARALSDLKTLLYYADRHLTPRGKALFLKGATWKKELEDAQRTWRFEHQVVKSKTESGPAILSISGVSRV